MDVLEVSVQVINPSSYRENRFGYLSIIQVMQVDFLYHKALTAPHPTQMFPIHYLVLEVSQCSRQSFFEMFLKKGLD